MDEELYQAWLLENEEEIKRTFEKECDLQDGDAENYYIEEFDKYCREWFNEDF